MSACVSCGCQLPHVNSSAACPVCRRSWGMGVVGTPAFSIVDMGDGTVHVAATVRLEDVDALVSRIRDVAAAAARRSA